MEPLYTCTGQHTTAMYSTALGGPTGKLKYQAKTKTVEFQKGSSLSLSLFLNLANE